MNTLKEVQLQLESLLLLDSSDTKEALKQYSPQSIELYNDMLCFSIKEALERVYPLTMKFFAQNKIQLVDEFRRKYPSSHYAVYQAVKDWPSFILNKKLYSEVKQNFLVELANFEWTKILVSNLSEQAIETDFQAGIPNTIAHTPAWYPVWNPTIKLLKHDFPITEIADVLKEDIDLSELPINKLTQNIVVFRELTSSTVKVFQIDDLSYALITTGINKMQSYKELTDHANLPEEQKVQILHLFGSLFKSNIILGSYPVTKEQNTQD